MAHPNAILLSVNLDGEHRCVDVFRRPDGTFGFDAFRRDPEDPSGWYSLAHRGDEAFETYEAALAEARQTIPWFADAMARRMKD